MDEKAIEDELQMELQLLHMKIELRGSLFQAEQNENWKIFSERFRCETEATYKNDSWLPTKIEVLRFLLSIPGVMDANPSIWPVTHSVRFYISTRRYQNKFLYEEIAFDILRYMRELMPITALVELETLEEGEYLMQIK